MWIHKIKVKALVDLNWVKAWETFEMFPGALPYFADKVKVLNKDSKTKTQETTEKTEKTETKESKNTKNKAILENKKTK